MGTLTVIDAHSLIVRCIMATAQEDLRLQQRPTGGVYGALQMLRSIVGAPDLHVGQLVACFDSGVPSHRRRLIPEYKEKRRERQSTMSDEEREAVFEQVADCWDIFPLLGVTCLSFENREGDDVVAAVVREAAQRDQFVTVCSSDADLLQTVAMGASVWDFGKKRRVGFSTFEEVTGVPANLYTLYRVLVGDTSDSIKGAHGVGPVKAAQLLQELKDELGFALVLESQAETPVNQFDMLCRLLGSVDRPANKGEQAILNEHSRLRKVARGVDLQDSFGNTATLLARLAGPCVVQARPFLQECKALKFQNILQDPDGFLRPFMAAKKRSVDVSWQE